MRVETVTAIAFGPFRDKTLTLAPQLTVVHGPNEAGKSSWHAAIFAALCGMRRAKGQPRKEDREFAGRHRPWMGDDWEVRAILRLDDERRVELRQNLEDLTRCSARDVDLGRDVSGEILNEGTPDGSKWLGLDRTSFLSVACVRQAEIQAVADAAVSLQDELQRAAASTARDATAGQAIERLELFQKEHVGLERANSTKPLQTAKERLAAAQESLDQAKQKRAAWLTVEAESLDLKAKADDAARAVRMQQARLAVRDAEGWRAKLDRARKLAARHPTGQPPPLRDDEALAGDVAAALSEWEKRPDLPTLSGASAESLRAEIDALPTMPSGEQAPGAGLVAARNRFERAVQGLEMHERERPTEAAAVDAKGLTADQLRELARLLDTPTPVIDVRLEERYEIARARLEARVASGPPRWVVAVLAAAAVVGGAATWALLHPLSGALVLLLGVVLFLWLAFRTGDAKRTLALEAVRAIELDVLARRKAVEEAQAQVRSATARATALGLPGDSSRLRKMANELLLAERQREIVADWSRRQVALRDELTLASDALRQALTSRGVDDLSDLAAAFEEYDRACRERAALAASAARRPGLLAQLSAREAVEQAVRGAQTRRSNAMARVVETAARCGPWTAEAEDAVAALHRWQEDRNGSLMRFDEATREYAELQALLEGGTVDDLEGQVVHRQGQADGLVAETGPLLGLPEDTDLDEEMTRLRRVAEETAHEAVAAATRTVERAADVPSVAEAEEALDAAQKELDRVRRLDRTLNSALEFLARAEERVHRDMAPVLAAGLRQWLPSVTLGRYTDAGVDPSLLSVHVLGPDREWRDAQLLSHGTAEQVYLLLRIVLAERLTTTGEACPLLLDDVLVQSDRERKVALLGVMAEVSRTRQVILFTQEDEVMDWARQHVGPGDSLVTLPGPR